MSAFTLRLEPKTSKKLDQFCKIHGYKKTGLVSKLISDFLSNPEKSKKEDTLTQPQSALSDISKIVGIISIGGNAVEDTEDYFS